MMVVNLHFFTVDLFIENWANSWLRGGVDIFFVISGFIMVKSTENKKYSPQYFYLKRIIRIVPLYWLATIVTIRSVDSTVWHSLASFLFLPAIHPENGSFFPVLQPGWTLNYEMFFYLIFGASLLFASARRILLIACFLLILVVIGFAFPVRGIAAFYTNSIVVEFVFGMIIAKSGKSISPLFVPLGFVLMPILYATVDLRLFSLGVPAALIVWGFVSFEHRITDIPILSLIGDASYSIYLFHMLVFSAIYQVWSAYGEITAWFIPVGIVAALVVGISIHVSIEKPITIYFGYKLRQMMERRALSTNNCVDRWQA